MEMLLAEHHPFVATVESALQCVHNINITTETYAGKTCTEQTVQIGALFEYSETVAGKGDTHKHARHCMLEAVSPDENRVMSTVLTSKDFLKTRQVMAERSWQDSCPIW